jgi:hypothetical protein
MRVYDIAKMPTSIDREFIQKQLYDQCAGINESVMRSYHIVNKIRYLLEINTPPEVILEMLELMEGRDHWTNWS